MGFNLTIFTYENPEEPTTIVQKFISFELLGEIAEMTSALKKPVGEVSDINESNIDDILDIMVHIFRDAKTEEPLTKVRLRKYADIDDIMKCFLALGSISGARSQKGKNKARKQKLVTGKSG